ncbi:tRNA (guanosine(46)-N7)-methyltransferase TrmB [Fulvivirga lutimaris]|uniref:tRNA (guanosine(46)-N7)-methyltransferase TrmB n=1 Tax=Fulvivirga lutimaris TaxID=1819566 RepID=UPI0012BB7036|nr:tRNA (guanosine(46)-N7)-methyltransferase TrmB [Fulvivirga lutimaris]MTI38473.1 tRNA (guanosine(46)-N7)-methyltransferase TrmB [Fulvivirga lutimaris]
MSRGKLKRFAEIAERANVIEPSKVIYEKVKGNWHNEVFQNNNPITLELACGRGEYTVGLGRLFPNSNHIGIDIKGDRIWKGSAIAEEEGLENVAFLRTHLLELNNFFEPGEVDEIWITFPDPRPRDRDEKRRVTHSRFINIYKSIVSKEGIIRLKTDNTGLFDYTLEALKLRDDIKDLHFTHDLYHSEYVHECHDIRTRYEQKFGAEGHDIKYLRFTFS